MHRLTQTLLAAQLRQSSIPYVEASLSNRWGGVAQLTWERIYSGPESDDGSRAALSSARSGALLRVVLIQPPERCTLSESPILLQARRSARGKIWEPPLLRPASPWLSLMRALCSLTSRRIRRSSGNGPAGTTA